MIDCLILGDSIAVGVGQARPSCETIAKVGISSAGFVRTLFAGAPKVAETAVISLGVNDDPAMHTLDALRQLRGQLRAREVTWLLPGLKEEVRRAIQTVAAEFRDRLVDTRPEVGPDHLHPTGGGYRRIAASTADGHASQPERRTVAALHPFAPTNPPQWLPMVQVPTVRPSFQPGQPGFPFRTWTPSGSNFAFRTGPMVIQR